MQSVLEPLTNVVPAGRVSVTVMPADMDRRAVVGDGQAVVEAGRVTGDGRAGALLAIVRSARAWTVVWVVFESLLVVLPSAVPVELTWALLSRIVPSATAAPTVTWTVKLVVPPTREGQATAAGDDLSGGRAVGARAGTNVVPAGRVSVTVIPPTWTDGPLLVTVRL